MEKEKITEEKILKGKPGMLMLFVSLLLMIVGTLLIVAGGIRMEHGGPGAGIILAVSLILGIGLICVGIVMLCGLKVIHPNEALVLTLFGNYYGTFYEPGFYWVIPFCTAVNPTAGKQEALQQEGKGKEVSVNINLSSSGSSKIVSLKTMTLDNKLQKVNDEMGNPVEIGTIVIWKVKNATKAVLNVDYYKEYLSNQTDSTIRNVARLYPYDIIDDDDDDTDDVNEKTLRGSAVIIANEMKEELSKKVEEAGIEIVEVRLNQIAYAPEIAAAMLQRQQAIAVIAARKKIVEGAVSMVELALDKLKSDGVVELDEERKAQMVSNLLVVLCSSKEANPVLNTGSIY